MLSASQDQPDPVNFPPPTVTAGSQVRLQILGDVEEWELTVVSSDQADPDADRISQECPIGEALLGRRPGDVIAVEVPLGRVQYRVLSVSHSEPTATAGDVKA
jgi:transcription elongation factor GreA